MSAVRVKVGTAIGSAGAVPKRRVSERTLTGIA